MKKTLLVILTLVLFISVSARTDWIDDAKTKTESLLEPFIGDIGAALSGGLYRYATPGKVDIGIDVSLAGLSDDTKTAIDFDGTYFPALYGGLKVGLPKGISVFGRGLSVSAGGSDESISLLGFGAKYTIIKGMAKPDVAAIVAYHKLSASGFDVNVISIGGVVSKKLAIATPYAGLSYEMTTSKIDTGLITLEPSKNAFRIGAGLQMKLIPFTYLDLGASYISGNLGYNIGLGLKI